MQNFLEANTVCQRNVKLDRFQDAALDKMRCFPDRFLKRYTVDRICRNDRGKNIAGAGALCADLLRFDQRRLIALFITQVADIALLWDTGYDNL